MLIFIYREFINNPIFRPQKEGNNLHEEVLNLDLRDTSDDIFSENKSTFQFGTRNCARHQRFKSL